MSSSVASHVRYGIYLARHKFWVFWYSIGLGVPLLGLLHDNSKFRPSEWFLTAGAA